MSQVFRALLRPTGWFCLSSDCLDPQTSLRSSTMLLPSLLVQHRPTMLLWGHTKTTNQSTVSTCSVFNLCLCLPPAILCPPHPYWRWDYRLRPDPGRHRSGVSASSVNHHRGGGACWLQGYGAPWWRRWCAEVNSGAGCSQRHRPICPVQTVQRRKALLYILYMKPV